MEGKRMDQLTEIGILADTAEKLFHMADRIRTSSDWDTGVEKENIKLVNVVLKKSLTKLESLI
jgi:hypothetical protein